MTVMTDTRHDGCPEVSAERWHPQLVSVKEADSGHAEFDMADAGTVVGPGEDCLVCGEPLVAGEVFVAGTWDGRSGPAHEDCPALVTELLANNAAQVDDEHARHEGARHDQVEKRG